MDYKRDRKRPVVILNYFCLINSGENSTFTYSHMQPVGLALYRFSLPEGGSAANQPFF